MSSDQNEPGTNEESNSGTDSVMPAIYDINVNEGDATFSKAACPKEKKITHQIDIMVQVVPSGSDQGASVNPLELMAMARRLVLCTSCGNLRLIT